ncbi:MAG: type II secretion system protein GspG [Candidatus Kaelpia imicola]|nr:type II secretion system protein GspG [Candidatus Kaelpia imicola]
MIYTRVNRKGDDMRREGFTLLEIIVVIIIVGIFAGVLTPLGNIAIRRTKIRSTEEKMEILDKALASYYESNAGFPADSGLDPNDLTTLETAGYISESEYSDDYAYDAWRVAFQYTYNAGQVSVTIRSFGPDRVESSDDILYIVQAKDIWKKWRRDTQERLRKVNQAVEKYISEGNTVTTGDSSEVLSSELDAADIYDPWGEPYRYDESLSTFYSYGPDSTPSSADEIYPAGVDTAP